jgi:hypothetical protein
MAYKDRYGKYPENFGTPDPVYPETPPVEQPPTPQPEPEPEKSGVTIQGWIGIGVIGAAIAAVVLAAVL